MEEYEKKNDHAVSEKETDEDKDVYKDGYCPYTLLNYICEKQGWLFSEFPFDVELDFK